MIRGPDDIPNALLTSGNDSSEELDIVVNPLPARFLCPSR